MNPIKQINLQNLQVHYLLFVMVAVIIVGITFSLYTFVNSYQEVVQNGMMTAMTSIEYPK